MEMALKIGIQRNIESMQHLNTSLQSDDLLSFQSPSEMPEFIDACKLDVEDVLEMIRDENKYFDRFYLHCFSDKVFGKKGTHLKTLDFQNKLIDEQFEFIFDHKKFKEVYLDFGATIPTP